MSQRLRGKVAIVTGAGTVGEGWGNGKAAAVLFAREGARVAAVDLNAEQAANTVDIIRKEGGEAQAFVADVADSGSVDKMVASVADAFGRVDILHNNVGITAPGDPHDVTNESWDRVMGINLNGFLYSCRAVLPIMMEQKGGSIVNISSITSIRNLGPEYISYPVSKAGVNQLSKIIAAHYGKYGIRCNAILPGFIDTPMVANMLKELDISRDRSGRDAFFAHRIEQIPLGRMGTAWDIANAALFLASDEASYITGVELIVDGGVVNQTI